MPEDIFILVDYNRFNIINDEMQVKIETI